MKEALSQIPNIRNEQGTWETFMVHATCENGEVGRGDYQTDMKQEVVFHLCKIMLFSILFLLC